MNFPVYMNNKLGLQSPYAAAVNYYTTFPGARTLEEDVHLHLAAGYVIGTPWLLALARPVDHLGSPANIIDPSYHYVDFDCWHIYLAVGKLLDLVKQFPYELPYISFERRGRLEIRETKRFIRLCQMARS